MACDGDRPKKPEQNFQLSRRSFLKGGAASGALLDLRYGWLGSNIHIESGPGWLTVFRNAVPVFRLQSDDFHGNPNIWMSKSRYNVTFGLEGARLPGTDQIVDLECELRMGARGLNAFLFHGGFDLEFRGTAEEWLNGTGLWSQLSRTIYVVQNQVLNLELSHGPVRLASDGALHFRGQSTALLGNTRTRIASLRTELTSVHLDEQVETHQRQSAIIMHRGDADWNIDPPHGRWDYSESATLFNRVVFSAREERSHERSYRAEFSRSTRRSPFEVVLREPLVDTAGQSPEWKMKNPLYSIDLGVQTREKLTAELARPVHLQFGDLRLSLRNPVESPALIAERIGGVASSGVIAARAGLEGKLYEQIILDSNDNWNVAISRDDTTAQDYKDATVKMAGAHISLEGAVKFRILRPLDALDLNFCLTNVRVESLTQEQPWLLKLTQGDDSSRLSLMLIDVGPQTLLEMGYPSSSPTATDNCGAIPVLPAPASKIAAPSQVALQLFTEDTDDSTTLSLDTLLNWWQYALQIVPQGKRTPEGTPLTNPDQLAEATNIIAPAGLSFSPTETQAFCSTSDARIDELAKNSRVAQIWHARLATRKDLTKTGLGSTFSQFAVKSDTLPQIRAVLSRPLGVGPYDGTGPEYGFSDDDTKTIVSDMATVDLDKNSNTKHVCLSSAGAWLRTKAVWPTDRNSISSFTADIANGEEMLEEITVEAILIPTSHRVTVIVSTKRQWCRNQQNPPFLVARLIRRVKIKYHEKTQDYSYLRQGVLTDRALALPFSSITLIGDETPYLDEVPAYQFVNSCKNHPDPQCSVSNPSGCGSDKAGYWANVLDPQAGSTPYPFPVQCVDVNGDVHITTMTMVVACAYDAYDLCYATNHANFYNTDPQHTQAYLDFGKARISYAQPRKKGDTAYATGQMTLMAKVVPDLCIAQTNSTLPWYPVMQQTQLSLDQLSAFGTDGSNTPPIFTYSDQYLYDPFDQKKPPPPADPSKQVHNPAELLLVAGSRDLTESLTLGPPISLGFAGKLGGGLALPQTGVQAVSRLQGTAFRTLQGVTQDVAHAEAFLNNVGNGIFKIADFIGGMGLAASLLGAVELSDILLDVDNSLAQAANVPILAARQLQTLEANAVQDLKNAIAPLLSLEASLQTTINNLRQTATGILNTVQSLMQDAVSFVKVTLFEQSTKVTLNGTTTTDIDILIKASGADSGPVLAFKSLIAESVAVRISQATSLPDSTKILPTLYQLRDYAACKLIDAVASLANMQAANVRRAAPFGKAAAQASAQVAIASATSAAQDAIDHIEQWLAEQLNSVTNTLNQQLAATGLAFASILESYIFQVADDLTSLNTAVSEQSDDQLSDIITALENVASDIAAFPSAVQQITSLCTAFETQLQGMFSSTVKAFTDTVGTTASGFIQEVATALNPFPTVSADVQHAAAALAVNTAITTWSSQFDTQVTNAITFINSVKDAISTVQSDFQDETSDINQAIAQALGMLAIPQQISVAYDYDTPLNGSGPFVAEFNGTQSRFGLHSSVLVNLDGTPPQFTVQASVTNFQLLLLPSAPFVSIGFTEASFASTNGAAPTVKCPVDAKNVQLLGPLNFVSNLASAMGLPPYMRAQISGLGVIVGVNLPIPTIESGAFDLVNLSFYAGVQLDFTGQPMQVTFGFANPSQHFSMIYAFLGGGGFIDLTFTPSKTLTNMDIAGALEAGAMLALDFGVASGEVHAFAGFYMNLSTDDCVLSGYFRCGGDFEVLGLISVSIEFTMSLTYEDRGGTAWLSGECDVVVDVSVLFFSTSVSLRLHHDFCGSSTD